MEKLKHEAASYIREITGPSIDCALILGSGLGFLAESVENRTDINYSEIPHFKKSTVHGHAGKLVYGVLCGKKVLIMQGRYHFYEGYTIQEVTFPVRVFSALSIKNLIITNAAGRINPFMEVGDLMLIRDHINMGPNPLIGPNHEGLDRFPSLDNLYSPAIREKARQVALQEDLTLREGVYLFNTGPTYETKSEILYYHRIGADAVGMSTVPEAIVARHERIENIAAISLITNKTLGNYIPTHEEVIETGKTNRDYFARLIKGLLKLI